MTSIPELEAQKRKVHEVFSKADAALHKGTITQEERDRILQHYYGTTRERDATQEIETRIAALRDRAPTNKSIALVAGFSILMLSLFGVLFYSTGGITGAVVLDTTEMNQTYTSDTLIPLTLDGTTRINVTGGASGDVTITLLHEGTAYVLYELRSTTVTPHASMRTHFLPGETVEFTAVNLSSAYLMDGETATLLPSTTIEGLAPGAYEIKLIINDTTLSQETLSFTISDEPPVKQFNACGEACQVDLSGNATLEITVDGTLTIRSITLTTSRNNAPQLAAEIPDATGTGTVTIDLRGVFLDPDGDALLYESTRHEGNNETFDGETFAVSGPAGTYTYTIYASDMVELTPSNIFSITLLENATIGETPANETSTNTTTATNETPIETPINTTITPDVFGNSTTNGTAANVTANTGNMTNTTGNAPVGNATNTTLDCSGSNPNLLPEECLLANATLYFQDQDIFWENVERTPVARFTVIGNLLLTGTVVEHSTARPEAGDFSLDYLDEEFATVPTIWIDSATGDLHLKGRLVEENANLQPQAGSYTVTTRRKVHLAYADLDNGDLIIRGNVIPYRRSLE